MVRYEVTVFTADVALATTFNSVFIKLVGTDGESERQRLLSFKGPVAFIRAAVSKFTVTCPVTIGKLLWIELDKQRFFVFPEDSWFLSKVEVKSPEGDVYTFPVHRWVTDSKVHHFREGTAVKLFEESCPRARDVREQELKQRAETYCWRVFHEGLPHCLQVDDLMDLPGEVRFSFTKKAEFLYTRQTAVTELQLKGLYDSEHSWTDIDSISRVFFSRTTKLSEYVQDHWQEDQLFTHQFLNGVNPILIRRCSALPANLPVTSSMVFPGGEFTLDNELKNGNIFLCDYKQMEGVETNTLNGETQHLMAPLALLHQTPDKKLKPIAIQLKQTPADDNPVFLPTDPKYDWLTAKIFVRSADFQEHQLNSHLLRTHLLAEVFSVSLLRNVPMVHPLYKLLVPHTRYTLHINYLARKLLISEDGGFKQFASSGGEGVITILQRSLSSLTYSSLCLPEDIAARGVEDVSNYHYRDDGLKLWDVINRFVQAVLRYYYENDGQVQQDSELQNWILDIFEHGVLGQAATGFPQSFTTLAGLIKFVTMVIFTCAGQHSAVNSGQFDYGGWMPNTPTSMQRPPPTAKGKTSEATMLQTLPDVNTTVRGMAALWLLSKDSSDFVPFGHYPDDHFTEEIPLRLMRDFQQELQALSAAIQARNEHLEIPYTYLDPTKLENSVTI